MMAIHEIRKNYYHITKSQLQHHKQIDSVELQSAVEEWLSKDSKNKIEVIPMGVSRYLIDLQKTRLRKSRRKIQ